MPRSVSFHDEFPARKKWGAARRRGIVPRHPGKPEDELLEVFDYCAQEVRSQDHDRYLTCLFAPAASRGRLAALYAFNLEVARTPELVSEAMLGRIRLQWWREAIEEIYAGQPRRHAVVEALAAVIEAVPLEKQDLMALVDAREFDLEGEAPADLAALEAYGAQTSSGLLALALQVLGAERAVAAEAARATGLAWALTGLLRAVPFHARAKRRYLPEDLCRRAALLPGDLFELRSSPALVAVVGEVSARVEQHLADSRSDLRGVTGRLRAPLLLAGLARADHRALARAGYDPFALDHGRPSGGRVWRLLWSRLVGV